MSENRNERSAVITGGSRGIGKAIARRLAADGIDIAFGYRSDAAAADEFAGELRSGGVRAIAVQGDVTDPQTATALAEAAVDEFGRLDIAVSNAGVEHFGALADITPDDVTRVFSINVAAQLYLAQAASARMTAGGRIVLTSSVSALIGVREHSLYAASKAAVVAMARNLAPELGERGITINAIAPGGTNTDMAAENASSYTHPALADVPSEAVVRSRVSLGRWAEPEEIADVVAFLTSPGASYVSGSTVSIDGGWM